MSKYARSTKSKTGARFEPTHSGSWRLVLLGLLLSLSGVGLLCLLSSSAVLLLFVQLNQTLSDQSVFGFKLLGVLDCVVDQGKSRGLSTTELGSEAVTDDILGVLVIES